MSNPPHPSSSTSTSTSTSDKPRPSVPSVPPAHINLISAVKRDFAPSNLHPSTRPFVRSFLFGYISTVAPPILKTIIKLVLNKKFGARKVGGALRDVFKALIKGLDPRGMGMAAGVAIGGARWGEEIVRLWIEELVRRWKVRVGKSVSQIILRQPRRLNRSSRGGTVRNRWREMADRRNPSIPTNSP